MKRNGSKTLAKDRAAPRKTSRANKPGGSEKNRSSAERRKQRIARGVRTLQELFASGERTFKSLDTETIVRIAEDKDLDSV